MNLSNLKQKRLNSYRQALKAIRDHEKELEESKAALLQLINELKIEARNRGWDIR